MNERSKVRALLAAIGATAIAVVAAGCGGDQGKTAGVAGSRLPEGVQSESVEHESCDEKSSGHRVQSLDANMDGKDDIKRVFDNKTGKEVCRITDLNHDGHPDMYEYYDANGVLRRREADYDDSGVVDAIEYYENGKLARRELDTTGQHRIDTWDYFDTTTGKRVKRERDSTNDGRIDQWWTWNGDQVSIAIDKNGSGKPDPTATVVIGANGQAIEDAGAPAATTDGGVPPPPAAPVVAASPPSSAPSPSLPDAGATSAAPGLPSSADSGDGGATANKVESKSTAKKGAGKK